LFKEFGKELFATINGWRDVVNKTLPTAPEVASIHARSEDVLPLNGKKG
jgi:hypothetical protein